MPSTDNRTPPSPFRGFRSPNYTPVPDELFDELLVELSGAELKALLYIVRRTFGFKRDSDNISLSQMLQGIRTRDGRVLDRGVGLSKKTLLLSLRSLEDRGIILTERRQSAEKGNEPTAYRLNVLGGEPTPPLGEENTPPLGEKLHQGGGGKSTPSPWGKNYPIQETVLQETEQQKTGINSNSFDLEAQVFKKGATSKFSKKRESKIRNLVEVDNSEPQQPRRSPSDFKPVGEVLASRGVGRPPKTAPVAADNGSESPFPPATGNKRHPDAEVAAKRPRGRPKSYPVPPDLELFTRDISAEFHDSSKLPSNLSFIGRVLQETGLHPDVLYQLMMDARQLTKSRGNIEKPSADDPGFRNRFPYFRKTLLDLVEKEGRAVSARRQA